MAKAMAPMIIDVRSRDEYLREHIPGSRNIPLEHIQESIEELREELWQNPAVILTCRSGRRAREAAQLLKAQGCGDVVVMEGGIMGWKKQGGEVRSLKTGISIMRQVQIVVGALILLGFFIEPIWFLVPVAGLGMLVAGLTGTCAMASVLAKLPWNCPGNVESCPIE